MTQAHAKSVVVFDADGIEGRRLSETAAAAGFSVRDVTTVVELVQVLREPQAPIVGLVAFECLWPDPQRQLRALRDQLVGVRLVVVHAEGSPRLRLGQRLWAIGLMDSFVSRGLSQRELAPVLKQAYADAFIERATEEQNANLPTEAARLHQRVRFLHNLGAAFASQSRVEGLLRELQSKLPSFLDYELLAVLVAEPKRPTFHIFPSRPIPHEIVWKMGEISCRAVQHFADQDLSVEALEFHEHASAGGVETDGPLIEPQADKLLALPMVLHGELIGCLSLLVSDIAELTGENRTILQLVAFHLSASLNSARILRDAEAASLVDELTGAANRKHLNRLLTAEWKRAERYHSAMSVVMLDIDHFKSFNDQFGHIVGDTVLQALSSTVRDNLRDCDHLIRYGGEEFTLLLPETGDMEAALVVERIRHALARQPVFINEAVGALQVTFSAGVAAFPSSTATTEQGLVYLADQALLHAKATGRNRTSLPRDGAFASFDDLRGEGKAIEKRRFPRVDAEFQVRYVPLPDLTTRSIDVASMDVSTGGMAIRGDVEGFQKNDYALVYMEGEEKPVLTQVAWTSRRDEDVRAGLKFVSAKDLARPELIGAQPRRRAAVMVSRPTVREVTRRVLKAAEFETYFWDEAEPPPSVDMLRACSLLVVGESTIRSERGRRLGELTRQLSNQIRIVVINEDSDRRTALDTIHEQRIEHLIGADSSSEEALFATLKKLLLGNYFGIKKYLLWGVETKSWHISAVDRKGPVLEGVRAAAQDVRCHPRITDLLIAAVDEMVVNALYHPGPGPTRPVTIECGSDGRMLAVAVIDQHGDFDRAQFFAAIGRALDAESTGMSPEAKSGSLGFRIMLSALSHLVVNVDPGHTTEVIGLIDLRKSLREHKLSAPGLGMFRKGD